MVGFYATGDYEPRQVRKEAAVSSIRSVPWSCLAGTDPQRQPPVQESRASARLTEN